jgi:hypothetical protein
MIRLRLQFDYKSNKKVRCKIARSSRWKTRLRKWLHDRKWFIASLIALLAVLAHFAGRQ